MQVIGIFSLFFFCFFSVSWTFLCPKNEQERTWGWLGLWLVSKCSLSCGSMGRASPAPLKQNQSCPKATSHVSLCLTGLCYSRRSFHILQKAAAGPKEKQHMKLILFFLLATLLTLFSLKRHVLPHISFLDSFLLDGIF